jgi:hypothetical protein
MVLKCFRAENFTTNVETTRIWTCSFHPGSRIRIFFHSGSRIRVKEFKYINPKNCFYVSSRNYDQGCSSRIRILMFYTSRTPDPLVKKHRIPDPQHCSSLFIYDKKNTDLSPSKVRSLPESLSVRDSISFSIRACAVRSKCCPYSWQSQGEIKNFKQWRVDT